MRWMIVAAIAMLMSIAGCSDESSLRGGGAGLAPADNRIPLRGDSPALQISTVAGGLTHPWDVGFLPDGQLLVTERPGQLMLLSHGAPGATVQPVDADFTDVLVQGEGGLMGLVVHPDFATSRRFTTCQTHEAAGRAVDVRLVTWELAPDGRSAHRVRDPLLSGLPVNPSGRHSGCRPTMAPDGALLVGTGDSARAPIAQDRTSLGGKVLRIDLTTGGPARGNPFAGSANANERLIWTYGHRNVQGIDIRHGPRGPEVFTAEHGPDRDDEINLLRAGGGYGWDPSRGGTVDGYDEDVPMTDLGRFPDAVPAQWSSGNPVEAICGLAVLTGTRWGALNGGLAVTALLGEKLLLMTVDNNATITSVSVPPELDGRYGRLRAARVGPDGALYVTSSNGSDDVVLRIEPS